MFKAVPLFSWSLNALIDNQATLYTRTHAAAATRARGLPSRAPVTEPTLQIKHIDAEDARSVRLA
jgi:hypothetical protein